MDQLKFVVLDPEDLEVVSAHVQDAIVRVSDVIWRPAERRLIIALNRFDWQACEEAPADLKRRRSALRFERVTAIKCKNVDPKAKDRVLNLLAVEFEPGDAPGGAVRLLFSEDVTLRLEVECLEAELADLGPIWAAAARPNHPVEEITPRG